MVEGSGFENRRRGNPSRGSNPFSSAEIIEESGEEPAGWSAVWTKVWTKPAFSETAGSEFSSGGAEPPLVPETKAGMRGGIFAISSKRKRSSDTS